MSHCLAAIGATGVRTHCVLDYNILGAGHNPLILLPLIFPERVPIHCWVNRECFSSWSQLDLNLQSSAPHSNTPNHLAMMLLHSKNSGCIEQSEHFSVYIDYCLFDKGQ